MGWIKNVTFGMCEVNEITVVKVRGGRKIKLWEGDNYIHF